MKKDCLSEVLRCWIEEIEERGRWLRAQLGPQPPNFPRYISSANVSTKCQREINKKKNMEKFTLERPVCWWLFLASMHHCQKKRLYYVNYYPPRPNHYHFAEIVLSLNSITKHKPNPFHNLLFAHVVPFWIFDRVPVPVSIHFHFLSSNICISSWKEEKTGCVWSTNIATDTLCSLKTHPTSLRTLCILL